MSTPTKPADFSSAVSRLESDHFARLDQVDQTSNPADVNAALETFRPREVKEEEVAQGGLTFIQKAKRLGAIAAIGVGGIVAFGGDSEPKVQGPVGAELQQQVELQTQQNSINEAVTNGQNPELVIKAPEQ